MKKKKKENSLLFFNNFNFWRRLINFWTFFFFVTIIYDFFFSLATTNVLEIASTIYIGVLAIYVGDKEFERWYNRHEGKHPGEVFIIIWTIIVFCLIVFGSLFKEVYKIPGPIVSAYIAVLTILVITSKSKQLYRSKKTK